MVIEIFASRSGVVYMQSCLDGDEGPFSATMTFACTAELRSSLPIAIRPLGCQQVETGPVSMSAAVHQCSNFGENIEPSSVERNLRRAS